MTDLGDNSFINRAAAFILGMVGLNVAPSDIYQRYPLGRMCFEKILSDAKNQGLLVTAIRNYSHLSRVPLLDVINKITLTSPPGWRLSLNIEEALQKRSPYFINALDEDKSTMLNRLFSTNWKRIGNEVDRKIRAYFSIPESVGISYILFGSFIWKLEGTPRDLDITIILEDENYYQVEVGAHEIYFAGLSKYMPENRTLTEEMMNVSVVSRQAIVMGLLNHDLSNIATWTHVSGICLQGKPLVNQICDYMLIQDVFVNAGFAFKGIIAEKEANFSKGITAVIRGLQACIFVGRKYDLPEIETWMNDLAIVQKNINQAYTLMEFVVQMNKVCSFAKLVINKIKDRAVSLIPQYLEAI